MVQNMREGAALGIAAGLLAVLPASLCAAQTVVNPVAGIWSNRQPLVIDVPPGGIAYYSLNGDDPESSGFAYDGPVLLDVDGVVLLRVAVVAPDGSKHTDSVEYAVSAAPLPADADAQAFVRDVASRGIVDYTAGDGLSIPPSLECSVGQDADVFDAGTVLSVPADAALARCVPCTVTDGAGMWRFVINVVPAASGVFSRRDVPFEVEDWDTVRFADKKFIYKIDDSWWHQPDVAVRLDRTKSHMISWQRIDYSPENPVKFFVLPPKPQIVSETDRNGAVSLFFADGGGYQLGLVDGSGSPSELRGRICIDTFQGDVCEGAVSIGFFYDSVYQGEA
ncbi:MAG: chitobiase/beta-hexosaminidase C-terminal domain-containing protein, partial [Treponemataceae bacterium]|nr:chitobiase/beta-hexosaminidase C-terminal domain-containing protein [Treponemataceae bacterium]